MGWHLNANPASLDFLIPTKLALISSRSGAPAGADLQAVVYPPGSDYRPRFSLEPLAVYKGEVAIEAGLPPSLAPDAELALTFQACDATTCLRPEVLRLEIP